eukprot:3691151-Amphidinium_carterae.1
MTFLGECVGTESDVDIDLPPWVCHFNDSDCMDTNVVTAVAARRVISADVHVAIIMFIVTMS